MILKSTTAAAALTLALSAMTATADARDQIQIVGSSTVFPFSTAVAERFGQTSDFKTPVVESTGSGGGMKLFCAGLGEATPDITNASRRIKQSEFKTCTANGVTAVEVKIGFDGIVLANSKSGPDFALTREQVFTALAKQLPAADGALQPNPHKTWADIDPALPDARIEVLGPPPTSGTRDAFVELVMEAACPAGVPEDKCAQIREDGAYIDAGENDNLIVQKLETNPSAVGIFGFSFLDQNADVLKGAVIDDVEPSFEDIAGGDYPVSRSLFFYIKKEHVGTIPGIREFALEFTDEAASGEDGYLSDKGLIPLPEDARLEFRKAVENLTPLAM